jgi:hypothetical protein
MTKASTAAAAALGHAEAAFAKQPLGLLFAIPASKVLLLCLDVADL